MIIDGRPGPKWAPVETRRACGAGFIVSPQTPFGSSTEAGSGSAAAVCTGTLTGQTCGAFPTGLCQGVGCGAAVCPRHGTYHHDLLLCDRCLAEAEADEARQREAERTAALTRQEREALDLCGRLASTLTSGSPSELLPALTELARQLRRRDDIAAHGGSGIGTTSGRWERQTVPTSNPFLDLTALVVPAWRRYAANPTSRPLFDVVRVSGGKASRPGSGEVARQPGWAEVRQVEEKFWNGEMVKNDDVWVYTATSALRLERMSMLRWNVFSPPELTGQWVLRRGEKLHEKQAPKFYQRVLASGLRVVEEKPITLENVLSLVWRGHHDAFAPDHGRRRTPIPFA